MPMLLLTALGTLLALWLGVRQLLAADALAGFFFYQSALGVAALLSLWLRPRQRPKTLPLLTLALWVASLAAASLLDGPWWLLLAVVAATLLVWQHRPDMALFSAATWPASLTLLVAALWRRQPPFWPALVLLLVMVALFAWLARRARLHDDTLA